MKCLKILVLLICCVLIPLSLASCKDTKPEAVEHDTYTLYQNYDYGKDERHIFDLALPKDACGDIGLIFLIHGGGWHAGDKEVYLSELEKWAERGYAAAALNYRYASKKLHNDDILDDIDACLKAVKALGEECGVNITSAILSGGSAGGHLSLIYAYSRADGAAITPVAVVSYAGPTDLADENFYKESILLEDIEKMITKISGTAATAEEYEANRDALLAASPISYAKSGVPTVICHGTDDIVVPVSNAYTLDKLLTENGVEHELVIYENSGHGLEADPDAAARSDELFLSYAEKYLKKFTKEN
ncbi:MAG: alpha/beta hydrolase [Clostridia bacterium]|nr:alpha/beta hydrolase [Clostridia bacterium]